MKRILGLGLVIILGFLLGCGVGLITQQTGGEATKTVTCECPQDRALTYAVLAAKEIGMSPPMTNPAGFTVVRSDYFGTNFRTLDVAIRPINTSTSEVIVRAKASGGPEKLADEFAAAFGKVAKP